MIRVIAIVLLAASVAILFSAQCQASESSDSSLTHGPTTDTEQATESNTVHPRLAQAIVYAASFSLALWIEGRVPIQYSIYCLRACTITGVDCVLLGSYLISEHGEDWTEDDQQCSSGKACGPFQLVRLWERHFEYPKDSRNDPILSAEIAGLLILRAIDKHGNRDYNWRDTIKCNRSSRGSCGWPVYYWERVEKRIREYPLL
jgi:hypothetical protein